VVRNVDMLILVKNYSEVILKGGLADAAETVVFGWSCH
jgi:hypothetical protein